MMGTTPVGLSQTASQLREAFDRSFAVPLSVDDTVNEDFLLINLSGSEHVLQLSEIGSLQALSSITPLPGPLPALMGLTGYKNDVVPVYDLRVLLGYQVRQAPRWLVMTRTPLLALAFDAFDRHLRHSRQALATHSDTAVAGHHIYAQLQTPQGSWPVVNVASVLRSIQSMAQQCA